MKTLIPTLLLTLVLAALGGTAQADAVSDLVAAIADESPDVGAEAVANAGPVGAGAVGASAAGLDTAGHMMLLGALLVLAAVFAPWPIAAALRIAVE